MKINKKTLIPLILSTFIIASYGYYKYILVNSPSPTTDRSVAQLFFKDRRYVLQDINHEMDSIKDEIVFSTLSEAAKYYLPTYFKELELSPSVNSRLLTHLRSKNFRDNIIPFLLHSRAMYYDKKNHIDAGFQDYVLKYFPESKKSISSSHALFNFNSKEKVEAKTDKAAKLALKEKMKFFISEFLNLYDVLFLQKDSGAIIQESQVNSLKKSFERILIHVEPMVNTNPDVKEAVDNLKKDEIRKETLSISISQFINIFLRKHFEIFSHHVKHKTVMKVWLNKKINEFIEGKNQDIIVYLKHQQTRKFAIHIIVDGLQGNLLKGLIGKNDQFLKQIIHEHENRFQYKPKNEVTTLLKDQQHYFLRKIKTDKTLLNNEMYLPFFKYLDHNYGFLWASQGVSTTPTISVRNLPMVMAGVDVIGKEGTGLPNFHYVDRHGVDSVDKKERAYYFFGNDALKLEEITQRHGMKTMFTRLKEQGIYGMGCNTNYDKDSIVSFDAMLNLALGEKVRDFGEINCLAEISRRVTHERKLELLRKNLLAELEDLQRDWIFGVINKFAELKNRAEIWTLVKDIAKHEPMSLPSYIQIYNPWPDHFAHFQGPFGDAIISQTGELNRLDYWLNQLDVIFRKNKLYHRTAFGMGGDHGLTPIYYYLNPEVTVLEKFSKDKNIPLKIKKISSDEGEGPKLNHPNNPESMRGHDVVIASTAGGNYMMDFFLDHKPNSTLWKKQPVLKELEKLKTISGHQINVPKIIVDYLPETLDYLVVRNTECNSNYSNISLMAKRNNIAYKEVIIRNKNLIWYQPSQGELLGAKKLSTYKYFDSFEKRKHEDLIDRCINQAKQNNQSTWCDKYTWAKLFSYTDRPDAVTQLTHLYDTEKAGSINLFPKLGIGYNTKVPGRHAGESFHEKDAFVGFWGGAVNKYANPIEHAVNGQVAPTLFYFLTGKEDNGFGFEPFKDLFQFEDRN